MKGVKYIRAGGTALVINDAQNATAASNGLLWTFSGMKPLTPCLVASQNFLFVSVGHADLILPLIIASFSQDLTFGEAMECMEMTAKNYKKRRG